MSKPGHIGENIRRIRLERGFSQEALAKRAGISRGAIAKLETGQRNVPTATTLAAIAEALGVRMVDLVGDDREPVDELVRDFLRSPYAEALEAEGAPVTPAEIAFLRDVVGSSWWITGTPTPRTLHTILLAMRTNPRKAD